MTTKSDMQVTVESYIGKAITGVVMLKDHDDRDCGFRYEFDDGTTLEVSSQGSEYSWVTVNNS